MRILVTGGRNPDLSYIEFCAIMKPYRNIVSLIIVGDAQGVDAMAARWAEYQNIRCNIYRADWRKYGRSAGPIRNGRMIDAGRPDLVIAFSGARGTADCVNRAHKAGIPVTSPECSRSYAEGLIAESA